MAINFGSPLGTLPPAPKADSTLFGEPEPQDWTQPPIDRVQSVLLTVQRIFESHNVMLGVAFTFARHPADRC